VDGFTLFIVLGVCLSVWFSSPACGNKMDPVYEALRMATSLAQKAKRTSGSESPRRNSVRFRFCNRIQLTDETVYVLVCVSVQTYTYTSVVSFVFCCGVRHTNGVLAAYTAMCVIIFVYVILLKYNYDCYCDMRIIGSISYVFCRF